MQELINNLNELKGALENMTDSDLIQGRMELLKLIEESLEIVESK